MKVFVVVPAFLVLVSLCGSPVPAPTESPSSSPATPTASFSPSTPTPTASPAPKTNLQAIWLQDSKHGWLAGARCEEQPQPTRDVHGQTSAYLAPLCTGLIFGTSDGGMTWQKQYSGDVQISQIAFEDSQSGLAVGSLGSDCSRQPCSGAVVVTVDGGLNWTQTFTTGLRLTSVAVSAKDDWLMGQDCAVDQESAAGCTWHLLKTDDGGQTWSQSPLPIKGSVLNLSRPTASDGWIATSPVGPGTAQIIATQDGGQDWHSLPQPETGAGFEQRIFFRSANNGWLVVAGQPAAGSQLKEVFSTTDGGQTWTHLAGALAPPLGNLQEVPGVGVPIIGYLGPVVFTSDLDGWMASPRYGLLHTSDGGANWSLSLMDDNLSGAVQFTDADHGWALDQVNFWSTFDDGATWQRTSPPDAANP